MANRECPLPLLSPLLKGPCDRPQRQGTNQSVQLDRPLACYVRVLDQQRHEVPAPNVSRRWRHSKILDRDPKSKQVFRAIEPPCKDGKYDLKPLQASSSKVAILPVVSIVSIHRWFPEENNYYYNTKPLSVETKREVEEPCLFWASFLPTKLKGMPSLACPGRRGRLGLHRLLHGLLLGRESGQGQPGCRKRHDEIWRNTLRIGVRK